MRWTDIPWHPPLGTLRWFAVLGVLFLSALAAWQWSAERPTLALLLWGLTLLQGVVGWLFPSSLRPVFVGTVLLSFPVGWVVSHLLLSLLFYGIFTPLGLFFRCYGRDALGLRRRPEKESYWIEKPATEAVVRYFHQS